MDLNNDFQVNKAPHILMVTNHGIHEWQIIPGLKDTGGQNIFVNQFTDALVALGYKITIVNRGGYPHPLTGKMQTGSDVRDKHRRIIYLEDSCKEFVRKEDMHERIDELSANLLKLLKSEPKLPDMIFSHYWDAAYIVLKALAGDDYQIKHIWVPHSLGNIKKQKTTEKENTELRMSERIKVEKVIAGSLFDIVATSNAVKESLLNDYGFTGTIPFIPPCIDVERYRPYKVAENDEIYTVLQKSVTGTETPDFRNKKIITEISRTDTTKRKDILIKAFSMIADKYPDTYLAVAIDKNRKLGHELIELINNLNLSSRVAVLGSVWENLPGLYNITDIYCSPSVMEGFGMSVQEAAACRTAVITSDLVPFAVEFLASENFESGKPGAIIVDADNITGFADAMRTLLTDDGLREQTAENAYARTIPEFTWNRVVKRFFKEISFNIAGVIS